MVSTIVKRNSEREKEGKRERGRNDAKPKRYEKCIKWRGLVGGGNVLRVQNRISKGQDGNDRCHDEIALTMLRQAVEGKEKRSGVWCQIWETER